MELFINGQPRTFPTLDDQATLEALVTVLAMQADRVAVEQNGEIVPRTAWAATPVRAGDRLEIVHFVGGGAC